MKVYNFNCVLNKLKSIDIIVDYKKEYITPTSFDIRYVFIKKDDGKRNCQTTVHYLHPKTKGVFEDGFIYGKSEDFESEKTLDTICRIFLLQRSLFDTECQIIL